MNRYPMIDVLRATCCLGVIIHHMPGADRWFSGGWIGVDVFFVLSGMLVAGLIFREHRKRGQFDAGRFLARRALKIYPAFYVFLAASVAWCAYAGTLWPKAILAEAMFVTNYTDARIWGHTWSLAVEEHFYIGLAALAAWLCSRRTADPFRCIPLVFLAAAVGCFAMRLPNFGTERPVFMPTHLRIDSLLAGVLIAWAIDRYEWFLPAVQRIRWPLLAAGVALLAPPFFVRFEDTPLLWTAGFTMLYVGAACLVLWALTAGKANAVTTATAGAGAYSYSIYLWHVPVIYFVGDSLPFVVTVALCFAVGFVMALLVEIPVLRLRDRWFPSPSVPGLVRPWAPLVAFRQRVADQWGGLVMAGFAIAIQSGVVIAWLLS
jgi:peptidoglycan/LPS O-acetylase OafA/YrhL